MLKKFAAFVIIFLFVLPYSSFAGVPINNTNIYTYNYTNTDPFHLSAESFDLDQTTLSPQYTTNGLGDIDFFYQVRDITGETYYDTKNVGGPQWFATVYEKYSTVFNNVNNDINNLVNTRNYVYRRTLGGQVDDIPVSVIGDIIDGFNFVFAEEPEPYEAFLNVFNNNENYNNIISNYYDRYPDPLETLCVITTDGIAKFNVNFANPYARHFPFWWNWYGNDGAINYSWWQRTYNWRDILATYTVEPVAYIYNPSEGKIYSRASVYSQFSPVYGTSTSGDLVYIDDLSGDHLYVTSGDVSSSYFLICSSDIVYYMISGDYIYNNSGALAYTIEQAWGDDCDYICLPRTVKESILVQGLDDYEYQINVTPTAETDVNSAEYLNATINIRGDSGNYGSKLAYITFRQRASFMPGYENFREASPIPFIFTNVSKGNAADNPLIFDLTIFNGDRVVKRMKFKWDAQSNLPNQDLGTFFIMKQISEGTNNAPNAPNVPNNNLNNEDTTTTSYNIEAKVTNRTGTRYMLYRYDRANAGEGIRSYTLPKYWKFDLTEDTYGTLPERFLLDSHSQIAPGLVTVYDETLDLTKDTTALDSFRLYEYNYGNPKDLWLNYKRVGGMYIDGSSTTIYDGLLSDPLLADADENYNVLGEVQAFTMDFTDIKNDEDNTENEIKELTGKTPVLPLRYELSELSTGAAYRYINSSALNSFSINSNNLSETLSFADIYVETDDTDTEEPEENSGENADDIVISAAISSDKMAVIPLSIRLQIPRKSQLLKDIWEELDAAEDSRELFRIFNKYGTVRVRSNSADELDADLFRAVGEKGSNLGVSAADCVSAFIYKNYLYLDFIVFAADAVSKNTGKTAFVEIFKDDDVPYIIIGDGDVDKYISLAFYVDTPLEPISSASNQNNNNSVVTSHSSGGTCNINHSGIFILLLMLVLGKRKLTNSY